MAVTDIDWGTVTLTNGETEVVGVGTSFLADEIRDGDTFVFVDGADGFQSPIVESVQSNTELTLRQPWAGPTLTAATYTLRYQWDSSRVSAMSRRLIMLLDNGNLTAFSQLTGPGVAVFTGPHSMEVRPFTDFVNGVRFDVQVDTLADRDAYDGQVEGFTVLVSDMGDGRSAIFTKNSNTSADWSDAAYITGPVGPATEVTVGPVTTLAPDQPASVGVVPTPNGIRLDFSIPRGPTGDITGVTPFWNTRLGSDTTSASARSGLEALGAPEFPLFVAALTERNPVADGDQIPIAVYTGGAWVNYRLDYTTLRGAIRSGLLVSANNLSDLSNVATARKNIGQSWRTISENSYPTGTLEIASTVLGGCRFIRVRGFLLPNAAVPLGLRLSSDGGATWWQGASDYMRVGSAVVGTAAPASQTSNAPYYYINSAENILADNKINFSITIDNALGGTSIAMAAQALHRGSATGNLICTDTRCDTAFGGTINGLQLTTPGASFTGRVIIEGAEF